ncbi:MAG: exodeoxyribonuclease VII large subunit [Spirochaetae bacterium HGW-Spirochaetae-1]|jgi:exodeoxyribonuclease VII large subunit|nr:MAG: exodeoxyribonuclease VII large subunit [Spirochaetae bacterium HGW-Spirochaetae-1]
MENDFEQHVYTVSELTREIKGVLELNPAFTGIWVRGEVYNLTYHSSGHIYFTLKDDNALVQATFFRYANKGLKFKLEEGMSVIALGGITVFEKRGSYQLNVTAIRLEGIGELQKMIEQLKKKLAAEGIFDPSRKRDLPFLPRRLGIVTSPTGAALRDIIKVALRRFPNLEIVLAPAKVQGDDAAATIVRGIEELNRPEHAIDIIIAGRGGGSFEDLMPFNEEPVVMAFFNSRVPIISAVGHQIDHPLSDDAADAFAPTPSAAAEIAIPVKQDLVDEINYYLARTDTALSGYFRHLKLQLQGVTTRRIFTEPMDIVTRYTMLLADTENRILSAMKDMVAERRKSLLTIPNIMMIMRSCLQKKTHQFHMALQAMEKLSPLNVMQRGYSITRDSNGSILKSVDDTAQGKSLLVQIIDGTLYCSVDSIQKGGIGGKEAKKRKP